MLFSGTVLHVYPKYWMPPIFSVLGVQGSVRHSSDCTAQGQEEGLSRSSWDQADTGYESGKEMEQIRKAPTRGCNPICIF